MSYTVRGFSPLSFILLRPLLIALDATRTAHLEAPSAFPRPCYHIPGIDTFVCATSIRSSGLFRSEMLLGGLKRNVDMVLLRHSAAVATLDMLSFDVVLGCDRPLTMLWDLHAWRDPDHGYWLVPPINTAIPSIRVDAGGLILVVETPYRGLNEFEAGIARALREARLLADGS